MKICLLYDGFFSFAVVRQIDLLSKKEPITAVQKFCLLSALPDPAVLRGRMAVGAIDYATRLIDKRGNCNQILGSIQRLDDVIAALRMMRPEGREMDVNQE